MEKTKDCFTMVHYREGFCGALHKAAKTLSTRLVCTFER